MRVFPDENNNGYSTLLAMGTTKKEYEPYSLPLEHLGDSPIWIYPPPKYFDFLLLYCPVANYSKYFQSELDTTIEKFQDFTVSLGCAELISLIYPSDTSIYYYTSNSTLTSNTLVYRKFITPDLYVKVNKFDIKFYDNITESYYDENIKKGIFDVKIELLTSNNFVLTFGFYSNNYYSLIVNRILFDIGVNNAKMKNLLSSKIYRGRMFNSIIDFQYSESNETLMTLTRIFLDKGGVYDLNIYATPNNDYFLKSTSSSSYETEEIVPNDIFINPATGNLWHTIGSFNDIIKMKNDCYKLVGEYNYNSYLNAFATFQFVRSTYSNCHENLNTTIIKEPFPINKEFYQTEIIENPAVNTFVTFNKKMTLPPYSIVKGLGNCYNENIINVFK